MFPKQLEPHKYKIGLALLALFCLMALTRLVFPIGSVLWESWSEEMEKASILKEASGATGKLKELSAGNKALAAELRSTKAFVPREKRLSEILRLMEEASHASGLSITNIQTQNEIPGKNYDEIPFTLSIAGTFHQAGMFINRLETSSLVVKCREVSLKTSRNKTGDLEGGLQISLFVLNL
jgi:Tfp pilus assembly protein PilO